MATTETIVARFEAQIIDFTKKMKEMADSSDRAAERVRRQHDKASDDVSKAWKRSGFDDAMKRNIGSANSFRDTLLKMAPALAAAFSAKEAIAAADTYKRFTNSLKVAGLEGTNLAAVQEALFSSAQKNGVALEPLSQLYGRASQSAKELGADQGQLLKFTDGVTAALRVQGGSMEQASGALTQLSQALSGGVIHAEEFNSINEGARPILEAVAAGNEKYGGSVTKLRAAMLQGKLTSAEFFQDFLNGSSMLEAKAAKAPLTVSASWQVLENALVRGIGQFDAATGATAALSNGLVWLADNIDQLGEALGVITGLLGGVLVASGGKAVATFISAAAASRALTVGATGAALASEGLAAALAMVGGPWGLAIIAIGAALGFLAVKAMGAHKETTSYAEAQALANEYLNDTPNAATGAGNAIESAKDASIRARKEAEKLTGKLGDMAVAYLEAANAAKTFEINSLMAARAKNGEALETAKKDTTGGGRTAYGRALRVKQFEDADKGYEAKIRAAAAKGPTEGNYGKAGEAAVQSLKERNAAAAGKTKTGKGRSAAAITRSDDAALAQATQEELSFRLGMAKTEEDRHTLALELLALEHQSRLTAIDDDKNTSAVAKEKLKTLENTTYANRVLAEGAADLANQTTEEKEARDKRIEALRSGTEAQQRLAELNEDLLTWQAKNAKTAGERARFEAAALASKQKRELEQIDAEIALAKATNDAATALRLTAQRGAIVQRQGEETKGQDTQGKRDNGDWGQWAKDKATVFDPAEINKSLQDIADNGLSGLTDGITDAIMGAKSLGDAFKDVAKSIIADLIKIAIKMLIFKALGMIFPGFGQIGAAAAMSGHAAGTDFSNGGLKMVGEKGPELMMLPGGTQVAPNNLLRSALSGMAAPGAGAKGATVNHFNTTVNATDAVLTGWVRQEIYQANMQSLQLSRQLGAKDTQRSSRNRL